MVVMSYEILAEDKKTLVKTLKPHQAEKMLAEGFITKGDNLAKKVK